MCAVCVPVLCLFLCPVVCSCGYWFWLFLCVRVYYGRAWPVCMLLLCVALVLCVRCCSGVCVLLSLRVSFLFCCCCFVQLYVCCVVVVIASVCVVVSWFACVLSFLFCVCVVYVRCVYDVASDVGND